MRAFTLLTLGIGVLVGLQPAWAAGPSVNSVERPPVPGAQPPAAEQIGQVVGSFTFPNPPIPPNHALTGIEHDGLGNLYCADTGAGSDPSQFFLSTTREPVAQVIDGPFVVESHSGTPIGITTDGRSVFVGDVSGADVDVYDLAGNYLRSFSVASQTGFPEGITFNRITDHLYVVDGQGGNKVSEFTLDGTFIQNFTVNGASQDGLAFDPWRCSYWLYDGGPSGTDTVRHYDFNFVEMESFAGPLAAGYGYGEGVAVIGDRLYIMSSVAGVATVVVFDITDAVLSPQSALCRIFEDGFESGDASAWSASVP
ncbi:MAG: hypothetical protein C3F15_03385 [Holophagae bacterium]|nr:MAG: hypothetical protein C3F15_03385 [Holophagae bacterium]